MPVAPFQIIAGPADVYIAPVATAFPAVNAVPGAGWVALGQTEGGVTVRHAQDIEPISTDQHTGAVKAIRTGEGLEVEFSLAELTLENYKFVLNNATVTSAAGPPATKTVGLYKGVEVAIHALLVKGPSPYMNSQMQYQVPVVYHDGEPELEFVKDDKAVLACTFTALEDLTAVSAADRFGKLVAQSA
jgi:hypothetical protein